MRGEQRIESGFASTAPGLPAGFLDGVLEKVFGPSLQFRRQYYPFHIDSSQNPWTLFRTSPVLLKMICCSLLVPFCRMVVLPKAHGYDCGKGGLMRPSSFAEQVFFKTLIPWQQTATMVFFLVASVGRLYGRNCRVANLDQLTKRKLAHDDINLCLTGWSHAGASAIGRNLFVWTHVREQVKDVHRRELTSSVNFAQALLVLVLSICAILQLKNVDKDSGISIGMAMLGFDLCLSTLAIFVTLCQGYQLNSSLDKHQGFLQKGRWLLNTEVLKVGIGDEDRQRLEAISTAMEAGAEYVAGNAESPTILGLEITWQLVAGVAFAVGSVLEQTFFPGSAGWAEMIWQRIIGG